jgi:hypothetical protein
MCTVDWIPLISTAVGAAVALIGTMLADTLRSRGEHHRDNRIDRRRSYLDFVLALEGAHSRLRDVADPKATFPDLRQETSRAMGEGRVYEAREKLLMSASPAVVTAGERALRGLGALRDTVAAGAKRRTPAYHDAYHEYAGTLWRLRMSIREDLGAPGLTPADLNKPSWDSRQTCAFCQSTTSSSTTPDSTTPDSTTPDSTTSDA